MGLKGVFGGLRQATVLGLEDQSEGPGVMRDEDEGNNRLYEKKREGYSQRLCWSPVVRMPRYPHHVFFPLKIYLTDFSYIGRKLDCSPKKVLFFGVHT